MRDHTFRIALLLGASALPGAVHAEDAATGSEEAAQAAGQGEQIVVTATRTPLAIEDVPATVTVIDAEDIADDMVTDIKDLVRTNRVSRCAVHLRASGRRWARWAARGTRIS